LFTNFKPYPTFEKQLCQSSKILLKFKFKKFSDATATSTEQMNLPVKFISKILTRKAADASKTLADLSESKEEHLEKKIEERHDKSPAKLKKNEKPICPPTNTKVRHVVVDLSVEEKEEKMKKVCRADPKWTYLVKNFEKIRKNKVQINFNTFLRGILNPSELREIMEKCVAEKSK
jgi:hypothetical protein